MSKICMFFFVVVMCLWSTVAGATVFINDTMNWIPRADISKLAANSSSYPFDVDILVESVSADVLESDAHHAIDATGPHSIAIAVDPTHHRVVTRFGTGTGVKQGDFDSIAKAGNTYFKDNYIYNGFNAIII